MGIFDRFKKNAQPVDLEKLHNGALLKAIDATALDNSPENRKRLYNVLLDVLFLVPIAEIPANVEAGAWTATGDDPLQFRLLQNREGNKLFPVFSDLEALRNWDPNTPYIGMKSVDLFKVILRTDADQIVINPFDPIRKMIRPGGTLTRQEFQLLAENRIPSGAVGSTIAFDLKPGERVAIGVPAQEPKSELVAALVSTARNIGSVASLYLAQIASQKNQAWVSQTLIGIQLNKNLEKPLREEIVRELGESIRPWLDRNEFLDFMILDGGLAQQVTAHGKLLYKIPK